jgi:ERCC4-related helicase
LSLHHECNGKVWQQMIRKWFIPMVALAVLFSVAPVWAAKSVKALPNASLVVQHPNESDVDKEHKHYKGKMTRKDFEAYRLEKLKEIATYFGIQAEGKTVEQLKKEVEAAKLANKDKWEAFKAEHQAKRLEHLREIAKEHGIKTEGKTSEELREELYKLHGGKGKRPHRLEDHDRSIDDNEVKQKNKQNQV